MQRHQAPVPVRPQTFLGSYSYKTFILSVSVSLTQRLVFTSQILFSASSLLAITLQLGTGNTGWGRAWSDNAIVISKIYYFTYLILPEGFLS